MDTYPFEEMCLLHTCGEQGADFPPDRPAVIVNWNRMLL